jgi:asparaginyl-tRNA synthetase
MQTPRTKIATLLAADPRPEVRAKGWLRTVRDSKRVVFLELNDGSCLDSLQVVADASLDEFERIRHLTTGSCIEVLGNLVASPAKQQTVELHATRVTVLGTAS